MNDVNTTGEYMPNFEKNEQLMEDGETLGKIDTILCVESYDANEKGVSMFVPWASLGQMLCASTQEQAKRRLDEDDVMGLCFALVDRRLGITEPGPEKAPEPVMRWADTAQELITTRKTPIRIRRLKSARMPQRNFAESELGLVIMTMGLARGICMSVSSDLDKLIEMGVLTGTLSASQWCLHRDLTDAEAEWFLND